MIYRVIIILLISINHVFGFNTVDSVFTSSGQLYSANKFEEALNGYMSIIDKEIDDYILYYNIGNCYFKMDSIGKAILYFEKALKLDVNNIDALLNLGVILKENNETLKAIDCFDKIISEPKTISTANKEKKIKFKIKLKLPKFNSESFFTYLE